MASIVATQSRQSKVLRRVVMASHTTHETGTQSRLTSLGQDLLDSICFLLIFVPLFLLLWWITISGARIANPKSASLNVTSSSIGVRLASVRIACLIFTYQQRHKDVAVSAHCTWARHCDRVLFVSNAGDGGFEPVIFESHLTKQALSYVYRYHFDEADWFLRAEDDTFVVVENLRYLLKSYSPDEPIFFGCKLKNELNETYMYGQAGYVLSKEALRRYVTMALPNGTICRPDDGANADERTSECLQNVGVVAGDSRDADGRETFIPFNAAEYAGTVTAENREWYSKRSFYFAGNHSKGLLSPHAISFSHTYGPIMRDLYYFIYKLRKFGRKRAKAILPVQSPLP